MKRIPSLFLIMALALPALAGCIQPGQAATPFDALARWVPADAEITFFLDLKPAGDPGRHWDRIRSHMEANQAGQEALRFIFYEFRIDEYGLENVLLGPAVVWQTEGYGPSRRVVAQVGDEAATEDALLRYFEHIEWEQEEHEGRTLYYEQNLDSWQRRERIIWTVRDGLLFVSYDYGHGSIEQAQEWLDLDQAQSLAALPAWRTLRDRLPPAPMGLIFFDVAAQMRRNPPAPGDTSLSAAMNRQIVATALAAVPEEQGMRVDIVAQVALQEDAPAELRALFDPPTVDPAAWSRLPAGAAYAFFAHDAPTFWPVLKEMFNLEALDQLRDLVGLDLEADLAAADGPLSGDFALSVTPPLPDQPISQGLPAGQLLILARGTSESQVADLQAAMERRGAVFGPREVEGARLQVQAGTAPSGYAVSYGFDGDVFLFGSSPDVVGQAIAAERRREGLVTMPTFQAAQAALPADSSFVAYFNCGPLVTLIKANRTEEQYQRTPENRLLESFDAIAFGLDLAPDRFEGVIYFFVGHD